MRRFCEMQHCLKALRSEIKWKISSEPCDVAFAQSETIERSSEWEPKGKTTFQIVKVTSSYFLFEKYYYTKIKVTNNSTDNHMLLLPFGKRSDGPLWCLPKRKGSGSKRRIHSPSHVRVQIDFIFKTLDSLSHLLCFGTRSLWCEESANIWQI